MSDDTLAPTHRVLEGDCLTVLSSEPDESIQLIVTSPPYADMRDGQYQGVPPDSYVEWFMARAVEFQRLLKPGGTFILNIKEKVVAGERHTYVYELVLAMRRAGWLWTDEWIWHKKTCVPGKWPNRFRDAWEHIYQFNKQRKFDMYQDEVMVPIGEWSKTRLPRLSQKDMTRQASGTGSGNGKNVSNWLERDSVYPTNVLHLSSEGSNKKHSATFPLFLPRFFVRLFSKKGDLVLDPFVGSGTSGVAALKEDRKFLGVDLKKEYVECALEAMRQDNLISIPDWQKSPSAVAEDPLEVLKNLDSSSQDTSSQGTPKD